MTRQLPLRSVFRFVTIVTTLVFLMGAVEILVRVVVDDGMNFNIEMWKYARDIKQRSANPRIGHEHRPHAQAVLMGVDVVTNAEGHRDRDYPVARQPGTPRVVMIGDSFIEGWGVRFEDTISKRLESLFARAGEPVEVMNTGVGNYNTVMEVEAFLTRDAKYSPDLVVLNYTFNDAEPVPAYGSTSWLARHSQAAVFFAATADSLWRTLAPTERWDQYYLGLYDTPGWIDAKAALRSLADHCRRHGARMMIVNWPELHDVRQYRLSQVTERLRNVAQEEGVTFVDLLEAVKDEEAAMLWVTLPDPHPNGYANQLYANYLLPFMKAELQTTESAVH